MTAEDQVDQVAEENAAGNLAEHQLGNDQSTGSPGQKDWKHFVAGGNKHGNQGAHGDDTARIKAGCRARKAALGNGPDSGSDQRPGL